MGSSTEDLGKGSYNDRFDYWKGLQQRHSWKGVLVLTAHLGNFELLLAAHAMSGYQIDVVHHTQRFAAGEALMTFVRERAGVRVIRKHAAARAVLRALQQGRTVGVTFDQDAKRSEAIFVPFFSEIASTSSGLARLVAITGAPVLPVFLVRQPDKRTHLIEIQDEIATQQTDDAEADIEENTRRMTKAVEDIVRRFPEQFLWTHRRYRTRPISGMLRCTTLSPKFPSARLDLLLQQPAREQRGMGADSPAAPSLPQPAACPWLRAGSRLAFVVEHDGVDAGALRYSATLRDLSSGDSYTFSPPPRVSSGAPNTLLRGDRPHSLDGGPEVDDDCRVIAVMAHSFGQAFGCLHDELDVESLVLS